MADWLNIVFKDFDYAIIEFFHNLLSKYDFLLPICKLFAHIGELPFLLLGWLGLFLLLIKKDKKCGTMILGSIVIGAIITSFILKKIIYRPRPYLSEIEIYKQWWEAVGAMLETDTSFPSGHSCGAMAGVLGYYLWSNKKFPNWLVFLYPIIMGITRICLVVHYPSDVIAGFIVGVISAFLCLLVVKLFYKLFEKYPDCILSRYFLTGHLKKDKKVVE